MHFKIIPLQTALSPSLKALALGRKEFDGFKSALKRYFDVIDRGESEENLKTHLMDLLKAVYGPDHLIEQQERIDFVIRIGKQKSPAGVLFEVKRHSNKGDMITTADVNRRAMHELVLYYMQQRSLGNTSIQNLVICTELSFFIFSAKAFERFFFRNTKFRRDFDDWEAGRKSDVTTDFFFNQIAKPHIADNGDEIEATYFELSSLKSVPESSWTGRGLSLLFKVLSPQHLLKKDIENDSNSLNSSFYDELLHIMGLEEREEGSRNIIGRLPTAKRCPASLIENAIEKLQYEDEANDPLLMQVYGSGTDKRLFAIALELCLTWITRLLFLKLLEAQILKFHGGDAAYKFLNIGMVSDFDELSDLFFMVLALKPSERPAHIREKFVRVPYLNSALFEKTRLERVVGINGLNNRYELPLYSKTVLKHPDGQRRTGGSHALSYIFQFLDAYDFGVVGGEGIREESKTIINAAVLGLIFEKINGYQEGAIFTPGYITMAMSKQVIHKQVLELFASVHGEWTLRTIDDLKNYLSDRRSKEQVVKYNALIDSLKICDPAVGSGHFLVSCLNEIIALKSRLGLFADAQGNRLSEYEISVDNDELVILKTDSDEPFQYRVIDGKVPARSQQMQRTLFHEKEKIIENCLFGVDINANSVRICQLRLWIELLKSAYYPTGESNLETLPNIDINIKCGNSLLSRFALDQNLSDAFNRAGVTVKEYRGLVAGYKASKDKATKRTLQENIQKVKQRFQQESLDNLTRRLDLQIAKLRADEAQADLFVLGNEERTLQEEKLALIRTRIEALQAQKESLLQSKTFLSALEWRFEFPEVLDDKGKFNGFDIIIANPPYMRVQEIENTQPLQKPIYERDYSTATGSYDLANLFFELAGRLSKPDSGNNIFIFPHKLFNSANGSALREYLMNSRAIKHLCHFGANQVFDSAITYTCIALFNSRPAETFKFKRFSLGSDFQTELTVESLFVDLEYSDIAEASRLYGDNQWVFFDRPEGFKAFKAIFANSRRLSEVMDVFVGLQTSRDLLYVARKIGETETDYTILVNPDRKEATPPIPTMEYKVEKRFFRPFLMGKDVHRYETLTTDRLVFFPYHIGDQATIVSLSELEKNYPLTHAFVIANKRAFSEREKKKAEKLDEWYAYIYPKNLTKFDQEKLTSMEICSRHPNIALDKNGIYHSTTLYSLVKKAGVKEEYEFFAAILNSTLFWWFLRSTGDTLQGDARRMKTNYINPFPLPKVVSDNHATRIVNLVRSLISAKAQSLAHGTISDLEKGINSAVYALYGLDEQDISSIEAGI